MGEKLEHSPVGPGSTRHRGLQDGGDLGVRSGIGPGLNDSGSPGDLQVLMEKEPRDTLCTPTRQQTIHIISNLW